MEPVEAVREGLEDLRAHQMAVIVGTQAALRSLLQRFDPQTLEQRLGSHSLMERLLSGGRKKRCWDMFRDLYDEIAQEAQDDYEKLFGREFSRAYEEQVRKR
jgi:type VI secretion system protein